MCPFCGVEDVYLHGHDHVGQKGRRCFLRFQWGTWGKQNLTERHASILWCGGRVLHGHDHVGQHLEQRGSCTWGMESGVMGTTTLPKERDGLGGTARTQDSCCTGSRRESFVCAVPRFSLLLNGK